MKYKYNYRFVVALVSIIGLQSCSDFLDKKPNLSLAVPNSVKDLQALLDNQNYFVLNYPQAGDIASDYFYVSTANWASRSDEDRKTYIWHPEVDLNTEWTRSYGAIFFCNVVLDEVGDANLGEYREHDRNRVKGLAHLFRGWQFFLLSQLFSPAYSAEIADTQLGIPLRLASDINLPTRRSTLTDTYNQIIADLTRAAELLPAATDNPTRPAKAAAHAALARVFLIMGNWDEARKHADACLELHNQLMDYNGIDTTSRNPFDQFNPEVLWHTTIISISAILSPSRARADSVLMEKYAQYDLRKQVLFNQNSDGSFSFKGNYSGTASSAQLFSGLAVDEVYLIKAESLARLGLESEAMLTLNELLEKRFLQDFFLPQTAGSAAEALDIILTEREKQLAFRAGIRWSDLRRLNLEPRFAKTISRHVNDEVYTLAPNDLRYTFLIPPDIIEQTGISQNPR